MLKRMLLEARDYDEDDPLNPARGCINGMILGTIFWGAVIVGFVVFG